ncbi:hypothetical protein SSPO_094910 [Streptomyces antimycoticus]|uniref:Uncharacterized protein n=1 Tax=Streptomyces antimycoticus TaxID=68175 RepID=A0A499UXH3_9ACTN|nr:hypothetical protein SSPO_094910 [Streptomyces antimycoticus]
MHQQQIPDRLPQPGSGTGSKAAVPVTMSRPSIRVQVTTWLGKIFTSRRRQNRRAVSVGDAFHASTKPLRRKKDETAAALAMDEASAAS